MNKEFLHMQKLAGLITEAQYKQHILESEETTIGKYSVGKYSYTLYKDDENHEYIKVKGRTVTVGGPDFGGKRPKDEVEKEIKKIIFSKK